MAAIASGAMIAQQVAGKATRDALFLSTFGVTSLPGMMGAAAILSVVAAVYVSRLLVRHTPARIVPAGFAFGATFLMAIWALDFLAPRAATVALYLYTATFGTAIISAFWSHINETFDPHTSRKAVSAIAGGGTVGGLLGGLIAWRASALVAVPTMLPLLATLNVISLWGSLRLEATCGVAPARLAHPAREPAQAPGALQLLRESPYLRNLGLIVLLGAVTSGLIDYVFSAEASKAIAKGPALLSFFSLFWLAVGVVSFLFQMSFGRLSLEKLGLAVTVGLLPAVVILGGAFGLAVPGLTSSAILRGAEATQRNSLFRAAYEMLYTPLSEQRKRTMKTLIDVGFDRAGTMLAAGITMLALTIDAPRTEVVLLVVAIVCAVATLGRSRPLHHGYVAGLEESLRNAAEASLRPSRLTVEKVEIRDKIVEHLEGRKEGEVAAAEVIDVSLRDVSALRSRDPERIRKVLLTGEPLSAPLVSFAILLLAEEAVQADAVRALRRGAEKRTGQLVDSLCDPDTPFDVRRRIPRVLSECQTQDAANGLVRGTDDARFEVRYECGRALQKITTACESVVIEEEVVFRMVLREVERAQGTREMSPSLDPGEIADEWEGLDDRLRRDRTDRGLQHVFRLLALRLNREALRLAFRALHEQDPRLRGTALEYLETVLPDAVRDAVWPFLGEQRPLRAAPPAAEILADLRQASKGSSAA